MFVLKTGRDVAESWEDFIPLLLVGFSVSGQWSLEPTFSRYFKGFFFGIKSKGDNFRILL